MTESVILNSPILIALYSVALVISLTGIFWRKARAFLPVLSAVIVVCASAVAVILGTALFEIVTVVLFFLAINLLHAGKGNK